MLTEIVKSSKSQTNNNNNISKRRVLLLGGRSPICLEYVRLFGKKGYEVHLVESPFFKPIFLSRFSKYVFKTHFLSIFPNQQFVTFEKELIQICKENQIDLVIPTCEEVFFVAKAKKSIESQTNSIVFTENIEDLIELHNKYMFINYINKLDSATLNDNEIVVKPPKTIEIANNNVSIDEFDNFWKECNGKIVLKPTYSRFASQIIVKPTYNFCKNLLFEKENNVNWVAQQFIDGGLYCSFSIAQKGKVKVHTVYMGGKYCPNGTEVGSSLNFNSLISDPSLEKAILHFVDTVTKDRNYTGQLCFDLIYNKETKTIYPIECNPRGTSGGHLFGLRYSDELLEAFVNEKDNDTFVIMTKEQRQVSVAMIFYFLLYSNNFSLIKTWINDYYNSHDVIFDPKDLQPFIAQFYNIIDPIIKLVLFKTSVFTAFTFDIEWNGE
ncbi:hypothetical protein ABK040_006659 [Willaertia magna]